MLGDLPSGATTTITIALRPTRAGQFTTSANVTSDQVDLDLTDNTETTVTEAIPAANLSLSQGTKPTRAALGRELTYTFTVVNSGPSIATSVILTNQFSDGFSLISVETTQGTFTFSAGLLTCDLGELPGGTIATVTIVGLPAQEGSITIRRL